MAIKSVSNDYTGRKKDINLAYKINPTDPNIQAVNLQFGPVSSFVAGTQKLIQRYIISLLTIKGSQPDYETFGTDFLSSLQGTNVLNRQDFKHIFNFANWKVISEFRKYQGANPDQPLDEQLNTATLESFVADRGKVTLRIKIVTLAGEIIDFLLPLPIV